MSQAELRALEESHRAAQARLGLLAAYLSQRFWLEEGGGAKWLAVSLIIIAGIRLKSRRLARRFYQLVRAMETGSTLGLPDSLEEGSEVVLQELIDAYEEALEDVAELGYSVNADDPAERELEELAYDYPPMEDTEGRIRDWSYLDVDIEAYIDEWRDSIESNGSDFIEVDDFDWSELDELFDDLLDAYEDALDRDVIEHADEMIKRVEDARDDVIDFEAKLKEQEEKNSSSGAGRVDRYAINEGRVLVQELYRRDEKVKLVARGLGPNPCSFCAMLASRGFVYRGTVSAISAGGPDSIRRYHDNCHCYPIVRFVDASELPAANSWLQSLWPSVTRGKSGDDARRTWRRWWESEGRESYYKLIGEEATKTVA